MIRRHVALMLLSILVLLPAITLAQQPASTPVVIPVTQQPGPQTPATDPNDPIARIKDEELNRSQVMQTLSYLSDVIGPRLTASPGMKRANEWTRDQLTKFGLQNAQP